MLSTKIQAADLHEVAVRLRYAVPHTLHPLRRRLRIHCLRLMVARVEDVIPPMRKRYQLPGPSAADPSKGSKAVRDPCMPMMPVQSAASSGGASLGMLTLDRLWSDHRRVVPTVGVACERARWRRGTDRVGRG